MRLTLKSFPKEWDQEERMNNLYGRFRKRELNPVGYDSKMTFWKNFIDSSLNECGCCTFTLEELLNTFVRNGRKPDCLKEVIDTLLSENEINYVSDFEALVPSEDTWTSWAVKSLVSTPLMWSFSKLKESLLSPTQTNYDCKFVHLSVVKRKANDLLSNVNEDLRDVMLTMDQLKDIGKQCCINEEDLEIVVHSLELQGLAAVTILDNKKLVKFAHTGKKIEQISEADKAVFSLKQNEKQLTNSVENLETQKQEMMQEAKNYLKKGMRPMAKSCLRKKKELEKQIDKHVAALDNIQILLARIHDTESNSKVFESYKISLSALKNQFKEAGLTEDSVSNTMAQVQEVLDIHDDIQTMLGEPASNTFTSDEDYETELEDLLRNKEPEKTEFDHFDLPEPPSVSPISNKTTSKDYKKAQQLA